MHIHYIMYVAICQDVNGGITMTQAERERLIESILDDIMAILHGEPDEKEVQNDD